MAGARSRNFDALLGSNVLGGIGVASGVAVGALLVEELGGTSIAGLGQSASILGAAIAAVPLARMAARRGRRWSLSTGYAIAAAGAVLILTAAVLETILLLIFALGCFGVAQAVNLQSRYAAADDAPAAARARAMSVVVWATTIGSVLGPNLSGLGERLGESLGILDLAGPYLFSVVAFAAAGLLLAVRYHPAARPEAAPAVPAVPARADAQRSRGVGALEALRWAAGDPRASFAVVLVAVAHSVMVMVMVMTPLHMQHNGMSIELVGLVISMHIMGMYLFSPVFGWLADRYGPVHIAILGMMTQTTALVLGVLTAISSGGSALTAAALTVLGLGWSACIISASALLADVSAEDIRVPLQGSTDAGMNYAAAAFSALAGPILAFGGFPMLNITAAILLVPALFLLPGALRARSAPEEPAPAAAGEGPMGPAGTVGAEDIGVTM